VIQAGNVFLIGFSGSGKSTVCIQLAHLLKAAFFDTDALIEKRERRTITEIFADDGERRFRQLEFREVTNLLHGKRRRKVIALGGGALTNPVTRKVVLSNGIIVYLSCSVREIYRRMKGMTDRPLLNVTPRDGETLRDAHFRRIHRMLDRRQPQYRQADLVYSTTNKQPGQAARDIYRILKNRYGFC